MRGSAEKIMSEGPYADVSDLFFVVAFARDCTGKALQSIVTDLHAGVLHSHLLCHSSISVL